MNGTEYAVIGGSLYKRNFKKAKLDSLNTDSLRTTKTRLPIFGSFSVSPNESEPIKH